MERLNDSVDAFRNWEKTHNRENYGRYDAFAAGRAYALRERDEEVRILREGLTKIAGLEKCTMFGDPADYDFDAEEAYSAGATNAFCDAAGEAADFLKRADALGKGDGG